MATNLPVIPTVYGVSWGEYNYRYVQWLADSLQRVRDRLKPSAPTNEVVILHLKPKS